MGSGPLNPKRKAFIREYLIDHNATRAAERAGYSKRTANEQGARLLVLVSGAIAEAEAKLNQKYAITAERVKSELAKMAFANMEDYVIHENGDITPHLSNCTRDQMAAIQEFTVDATGGTGDGERKLIMRTRLKLADKTRALELLGKCRDLSLFSDRVEVTASDEILSAIAEGRQRVAKCRQR